MKRSLQWPTGYGWSLLSCMAALMISTGYYMPYWLINGHMCLYMNCTGVHFGPFRRCGYPRVTNIGIEVLTDNCGRYMTFEGIPSMWWKLTTIFVGLGAGLALLTALVTIPACFIRDIVTKTTGKALGIAQAFGGAFTCVGCLLFPAGWENREVVDVCTQASFYRLGSCSIGWAFWTTLGGSLLLLICAGLSFESGLPLPELKMLPPKIPIFNNPLETRPNLTTNTSLNIPQSATQPLLATSLQSRTSTQPLLENSLQSRTVTTFGAESNQYQSVMQNSNFYPASATIPRKSHEYRTIII